MTTVLPIKKQDRTITLDVQKLIKAVNGEIILTDDEFRRADLNNDGIISIDEAQMIIKYINNAIDSFEFGDNKDE